MTLRLKTIVLRDVTPPPTRAVTGVELVAKPSAGAASTSSLRVETTELSEGERSEVATEKDALSVGVAMPFTLIAPLRSSAVDSGGPAWGIEDVGAEELKKDAGSGIKVAVLDTGIDGNHPAFDGLELITENFTDESPQDLDGHGTHCAGTIFGQDVEGRRIGIARGVRNPLIAKVLGNGGGDSQSIFDAILWAQRNGAQIISMSLGIDFPSFRERLIRNAGLHERAATSVALQAYRDNIRLFDKLSQLFANDAIINTPLLIAAAGNESSRPAYTINSAPPAAADDILSVAALDRTQQVALFSNTNPDCCAPGVDILSASLGGGLVHLSGTSMAAPHVAAVAVLCAERLNVNGRITARALREEVLAGAQPLPHPPSDVGRGKIVVVP